MLSCCCLELSCHSAKALNTGLNVIVYSNDILRFVFARKSEVAVIKLSYFVSFSADFGLAKQKKETSKMTSVVGTILYSCPEIIKNEPYGEKADIWALGKCRDNCVC